MSGKIKGFLLRVYDDVTSKEVEFEETLENIYKLLSVETIDVTMRKIGSYVYDVVCDDEGLFVQDCLPNAIDSNGKPQLVGNLLLVNHDGEGNFASLTEEQIQELKEKTVVCCPTWNGKPHIYRALKEVDYV